MNRKAFAAFGLLFGVQLFAPLLRWPWAHPTKMVGEVGGAALWLDVAYVAVLLLLAFLALRKAYPRGELLRASPRNVAWAWAAFAAGASMMAVAVAGEMGLSRLGVSRPFEVQWSGNARVAVVALLPAIFAAFYEEVMFRGLMLTELRRNLGAWGALAAQAALFAAVHTLQASWSMAMLMTMLALGFVLGLLVLSTGSLFASIGLHFGWNYAAMALFGIRSAPGSGEPGLLRLRVLDAAAGGGPSGVGVGLAPVVLCMAALALYAAFKWKPSAPMRT